jgi:hypothetical protein
MNDRRSAWKAAGWIAGFSLAGWWLLRLGRVEWLQIDWSDPWSWLTRAETEVAVAMVVRILALAVVVWVLSTSALYAIGRLLGVRPTSIDWLSIGPVRKAVDALVAGSLVVTTMAPAGAAVDPLPAPPPATAEMAGSVDPAYVPVPAGRPEPAPPVETERADVHEPPEAPPADEVVVRAGDNLWKLAEGRLAASLGRPPTSAEVAPYWVRVVEGNRDRFRSGNPDLIFPGERVWMPPVAEES